MKKGSGRVMKGGKEQRERRKRWKEEVRRTHEGRIKRSEWKKCAGRNDKKKRERRLYMG